MSDGEEYDDDDYEVAARGPFDPVEMSREDPSDSVLGVGIVRPPRNTTKAPLPEASELKRSALGRTGLFLPGMNYHSVRCSSSITQHVQRHSVFHAHKQNGRLPEEYTKPCSSACWHCCHSFEGGPVPVPRDYDASEGKFIVYGTFCSLSCAKGFLQETPTFNTGYQITLLAKMAREVYGVNDVRAAPPRLSLDVFGGPFPIERFRSTQNTCKMHTPPFVSTYMVVEERQQMHDASAMGGEYINSVRGIRRPATSLPHARDAAVAHEAVDAAYDKFVAEKGAVAASGGAKAAPPQGASGASSTRRTQTTTLSQFMKKASD